MPPASRSCCRSSPIGFGIPLWLYVLVPVWLGQALISIRTFAEHQWSERPEGRTIIVERSPLSFLFLNNNLHFVHHKSPTVAWYRLPKLFRDRRDEWVRDEQRLCLPELFRAAEGVSPSSRRSRWCIRRCGARRSPAAPSVRACAARNVSRPRHRAGAGRAAEGMTAALANLPAFADQMARMSDFIAALPMYDWPETRAETDAEWARFARRSSSAPASTRRRSSCGAMPTCRRARRHPRQRWRSRSRPTRRRCRRTSSISRRCGGIRELLLRPDLLGTDGARACRACGGGRPAELRRVSKAGRASFIRARS